MWFETGNRLKLAYTVYVAGVYFIANFQNCISFMSSVQKQSAVRWCRWSSEAGKTSSTSQHRLYCTGGDHHRSLYLRQHDRYRNNAAAWQCATFVVILWMMFFFDSPNSLSTDIVAKVPLHLISPPKSSRTTRHFSSSWHCLYFWFSEFPLQQIPKSYNHSRGRPALK